MLQGLDSLTHLLTQREPFGTPHSGSGAPRTGTLNFKCLGVLVVFDSDELAQLLDAVGWQRLREQISRMTLCRNLHSIQQAFIPRCLQPKMSRAHLLRQPKSLTCCVVHHPLVVVCKCHTRVVPEVSEPTFEVRELPLQLTPQRTVHFSHDESDTAFCLLDQNLKRSSIVDNASLRSLSACLLDLLPNRCRVYAMMWSDRTPHL